MKLDRLLMESPKKTKKKNQQSVKLEVEYNTTNILKLKFYNGIPVQYIK